MLPPCMHSPAGDALLAPGLESTAPARGPCCIMYVSLEKPSSVSKSSWGARARGTTSPVSTFRSGTPSSGDGPSAGAEMGAPHTAAAHGYANTSCVPSAPCPVFLDWGGRVMALQERMPTQRQPRPRTRRAYHPSITQHPHKRMQQLRHKHECSIRGKTPSPRPSGPPSMAVGVVDEDRARASGLPGGVAPLPAPAVASGGSGVLGSTPASPGCTIGGSATTGVECAGTGDGSTVVVVVAAATGTGAGMGVGVPVTPASTSVRSRTDLRRPRPVPLSLHSER